MPCTKIKTTKPAITVPAWDYWNFHSPFVPQHLHSTVTAFETNPQWAQWRQPHVFAYGVIIGSDKEKMATSIINTNAQQTIFLVLITCINVICRRRSRVRLGIVVQWALLPCLSGDFSRLSKNNLQNTIMQMLYYFHLVWVNSIQSLLPGYEVDYEMFVLDLNQYCSSCLRWDIIIKHFFSYHNFISNIFDFEGRKNRFSNYFKQPLTGVLLGSLPLPSWSWFNLRWRRSLGRKACLAIIDSYKVFRTIFTGS